MKNLSADVRGNGSPALPWELIIEAIRIEPSEAGPERSRRIWDGSRTSAAAPRPDQIGSSEESERDSGPKHVGVGRSHTETHQQTHDCKKVGRGEFPPCLHIPAKLFSEIRRS